MLDALAQALEMAPAERDYLHVLVHGGPPPAGAVPEETLAPGLAGLVDPRPSYVTGRCWDVLGANRAARALWTDWAELPPPERNPLLWMFTPAAREVFVKWEQDAAAQLARFRAATAREPPTRSSPP